MTAVRQHQARGTASPPDGRHQRISSDSSDQTLGFRAEDSILGGIRAASAFDHGRLQTWDASLSRTTTGTDDRHRDDRVPQTHQQLMWETSAKRYRGDLKHALAGVAVTRDLSRDVSDTSLQHGGHQPTERAYMQGVNQRTSSPKPPGEHLDYTANAGPSTLPIPDAVQQAAAEPSLPIGAQPQLTISDATWPQPDLFQHPSGVGISL